jgi:hypothetical protein
MGETTGDKKLDIENLENRKKYILMAETASLLFNLGKTHVGFWNKKNKDFFKDSIYIKNPKKFEDKFKYAIYYSYKDYYKRKDSKPFEIDLNNTGEKVESGNTRLYDFIINQDKEVFLKKVKKESNG